MGLLFGSEEVMMEEEDEWLSFPHKIIHEYIAANYLVQEIAKNHDILKQLFPKWKDIKRHEEVYNFCIGCTSDAEQASVFVNHFCAVLSKTMIRNVKHGEMELSHSGIYKIDTIAGQYEERAGYSDKAELTQVFSAISREARAHGNTCTNPVCNKYIHVYPACNNINPTHISQSKLIIFTESIKFTQYSSASDKVADQQNWDEQCLVILGDKETEQHFISINHAMSNSNVTHVFMLNCMVRNSADIYNDQNVNRIFRESMQVLYMRACTLPGVLWDEVGHGLAGNEAMESVLMVHCTGVTEYLVSCIASCTALTTLWLPICKLSSEMCRMLCRQLVCLTQLEVLNLSKNPVWEHVTHITAAITAWGPAAPLRRLCLQDCELPAELVPALLSAVTQCCPLLEVLSIGGNSIGGHLPSFMAAAPASLQYLGVDSCNLQPEDVASITTALIHNTLPRLVYLDMEDNSLIDSVVEPLLQAANTHHHGKLEVELRGNNLSAEFTTRWSSQSRPQVHLILHPQA